MYAHNFVVVETVWFILLFTDITATITLRPSNAVAEIGMQVKLNCAADAPIDYWFLSKDGTATDQLTIVGPGCYTVNAPFRDHYRVDAEGGGWACHLIVFNITMEQAGVYKCSEAAVFSSSILSVIEHSPSTTFNTTENVVVANENVIITCSLNHNGSVAPAPTLRPYFLWKDSNGKNVSSSYDWTTENTSVSEITVTAGREDISPYSCHVYLQLIPPSTPNYASNTPPVNRSASSPTIDVLYGVYQVGFLINTQYISIGGTTCEVSVMTCNSNGNPPPSYEWLDTKDNVIISYDVTLDLAEIGRKYTCVAYNTIRNEVHRHHGTYIPNDNSATEDCRFPRNESTWISVTVTEGCDSGTCSCSSGSDGFLLLCNANSYPTALYHWTGPNNSVIDFQVYQNVRIYGIYRCTAYLDRASSDYTGNVLFSNGTSEIRVTECYELPESSSSDVVIAMCVLFGISFAANIAILVIWVYNHRPAKQDQLKRTDNVLQPEMMDPSNRTSAPAAYEELNRPDETRSQQSAYEKLAPNPTIYAETIIP